MDMRKSEKFLMLVGRMDKKSKLVSNDNDNWMKINNKYMTGVEREAKTLHQTESLQRVRSLLKSKKRTLGLLRSEKEALDYASKGKLRSMARALKTAWKERPVPEESTGGGSVEDVRKAKTADFAGDLVRNLAAQSNKGHRYSQHTKDFLTVLRIVGGPRVTRMLTANLGTMHDRNLEKNEKTTGLAPFKVGWHVSNWIALRTMYREALGPEGLSAIAEGEGVIVFAAEDETGVEGSAEWDPSTDWVVGFCGAACAGGCETIAACRKAGQCPNVHQCDPDCMNGVGPVGNDYEKMKEICAGYRKAGNARAIILNPQHPTLPRLVVLYCETCLGFTTDNYVLHQWQLTKEYFNEYLAPIFGKNLAGQASDGASTRRKAMWRRTMKGLERGGKVPYGLWGAHGFTVAGTSVTETVGGVTKNHVEDIGDQDFCHNGKKYVAALDSAMRTIRMGAHSPTMNDVRKLIDGVHTHHHGLKKSDGDRKGYNAMDFPSVVRLTSPRVLETLERDPSAKGTVEFLKLLRRYLEMFLSKKKSIESHIKSAGYIVTYLRLWRQWLKHKPGLTLKEHFITREAFQDLLISCHFVVLLVMCHRDFSPSIPVDLSRTGTDCVEDLWSSLGSMVMNKRTYTILRGLQGIRKRNTLLMLAARSNIMMPKNNKRLKITNIFVEDDNLDDTMPDMEARSVTDEMMTRWWNIGGEEARLDVRDIGMGPGGDRRNPPRSWTHPEDDDGGDVPSGDGIESDEETSEAEKDPDEDNEDDQDDSDDDDEPLSVMAQRLAENMEEAMEGDEELPPDEMCPEATATFSQTIRIPDLNNVEVHKSTAMSYLVNPKKISSDRLVRYKESNKTMAVEHVNLSNADPWVVRLGSNVAVLYESSDSRRKIQVHAGRITRIRVKKNGRGWQEYTRDINLTEMRENVKKNNDKVAIQCFWYRHKSGNTRRFTFDCVDSQVVGPEMIVGPVNMTYKERSDEYEADTTSIELMKTAQQGKKFF
jgi:predicted SprT family Zn-dependent metalloprotease